MRARANRCVSTGSGKFHFRANVERHRIPSNADLLTHRWRKAANAALLSVMSNRASTGAHPVVASNALRHSTIRQR